MFRKLFLILFILLPFICEAKNLYVGDTGKKRLVKINEKGKVLWEINNVKAVDIHVLDNGNVLFCHANTKGESFVREVTPDKKTVWEYREKAELRSCQRLENGDTVIGQTTDGLIQIVDSNSKLIKSISIQSKATKPHSRIRGVRKGVNGLYYVAQHQDGLARVYNDSGELVNEYVHLKNVTAKADKVTKNVCYSVVPLKDGSLLTSGLSEIKWFDPQGKLKWSIKDSDIPEYNIYSFTGFYVLENGNIVATNWLGHGAKGKGHHLVEISPDKKVVWSLKNNAEFMMPGCVAVAN